MLVEAHLPWLDLRLLPLSPLELTHQPLLVRL
jgi:hypothetical protein